MHCLGFILFLVSHLVVHWNAEHRHRHRVVLHHRREVDAGALIAFGVVVAANGCHVALARISGVALSSRAFVWARAVRPVCWRF